MNDPLLKAIEQPLNPEEEVELARRFSDAYCRTEAITSEPAFERTQQKISRELNRLSSAPIEGLVHVDNKKNQDANPDARLGTGLT